MTPLSEVPRSITAQQLLPVLARLEKHQELQHIVQKRTGDSEQEPAVYLMLIQKQHWSGNIVPETILYLINSLILVVLSV